MTDKERITQLEARIAQIEARLAAVETRPMPAHAPFMPYNPTAPGTSPTGTWPGTHWPRPQTICAPAQTPTTFEILNTTGAA